MTQLLIQAAWALVPTGVFAAAFFWLGNRSKQIHWDVLAIGIAFLWGYLRINQTWAPKPSLGVVNWLPYGVLALAVLTVWKGAERFRWILTLVCVASLTALISRKTEADWAALIIGLTGLVSVLRWCWPISRLCQTEFRGWDVSVVFGLTAAAAMVVFFEAGSSKSTQVVSLLGVIAIACFFVKRSTLVAGPALAMFGLIFWYLAVFLHYFAYYFPLSAMLSLIAMPLVAFELLGRLEKWPVAARIISYALLLCLGALAIWLTKQAAPEPYYY